MLDPLKEGETRQMRALRAGAVASQALFALEEVLGAPGTGMRPEVYKLRCELDKLRCELAYIRDRIHRLSDDLAYVIGIGVDR